MLNNSVVWRHAGSSHERLYRSTREDEDKSYNSFSSHVRIHKVRLHEAVPIPQELTPDSEQTVRHNRAWNIRTDKNNQKTYKMY